MGHLSSLLLIIHHDTAEEEKEELPPDVRKGKNAWTNFEAGKIDAKSIFRVSQTLFGREKEIEQLTGALDRAVQGATEVPLYFNVCF